MKYCKECKLWKDEHEFSKDITAKDGLRYRCKQCDADYRNYLRVQPKIRNKQEIKVVTENNLEVVKLPENYKICNCCKQVKLFEEFYRNKNHIDGRADTCKICQEARRRGEIEAYTPLWKIRNEKGQKQCTKCKQWKDETEFSKGSLPDGLNTVCKFCDKTRAATFRKPREQYAYEMYNEQGQKQCSKCKQWKSIDNFCTCTANRDGLSHYCRQCQHEYDMKRRETPYIPNYLQHKDGKKLCLTCKQWIDEHDFYKSSSSKDGLSSRCKYCQQKYDKEHREQILVRQRKYKQDAAKSPSFRLNDSFSAGIRTSLKENKAGQHWEDLVPYTLQQLKEHLESQFDENMNWNNYGSYWEVDHVIPKNTFEFTTYTDKEFQICWSLDNLRPLEKVVNRQRPKDGSDISEELKQKILNQVI